jgi:DNA mismatch repair protein MSH5
MPLNRMQKCQTVPVDFVALKSSVDAAIQVHGIICGDVKRAGGRPAEAFISHITNLINPRCLIEISRRIEATIDLEMTKQTKEICINDGFSADLDNAKMRFDELDDLLSRVGVTVAQRAPQLGQLQVIFLPQVGFLVAVQKAAAPSSFAPPPDFEFTFEEAESMYFKSTEMFVLDDQEGDLDALIKDTESFLAAELEEDIIEHDLSLRNTFRGLSELDCILSLSTAAAELNFCRPEVVDDERVVLIENGRSPLQEIVTEHKYIPNDTAITTEHPIAMITGSNYSGKSCYMNQVGVILFLAQIGSFVPATRAKVGIADKILVRITSVETCSLPQSTFQIDLTQMGSILKQATEKSLGELNQNPNPHRVPSHFTPRPIVYTRPKLTPVAIPHFRPPPSSTPPLPLPKF